MQTLSMILSRSYTNSRGFFSYGFFGFTQGLGHEPEA